MTKKKAAQLLGIPTYYIKEVKLHCEGNTCDTYAVLLAARVKGFGRRGEEVLFPVRKGHG